MASNPRGSRLAAQLLGRLRRQKGELGAMDDRIVCDEERLQGRRSTGQAVRKQQCQSAARLNVWRPLHGGPLGHHW